MFDLNGDQPPALKTLIFEFDKHGKLNFRGMPTCTTAKLEGTTPDEARKRCSGALLGTGTGKARVEVPGKPPFSLEPRDRCRQPVVLFGKRDC